MGEQSARLFVRVDDGHGRAESGEHVGAGKACGTRAHDRNGGLSVRTAALKVRTSGKRRIRGCALDGSDGNGGAGATERACAFAKSLLRTDASADVRSGARPDKQTPCLGSPAFSHQGHHVGNRISERAGRDALAAAQAPRRLLHGLAKGEPLDRLGEGRPSGLNGNRLFRNAWRQEHLHRYGTFTRRRSRSGGGLPLEGGEMNGMRRAGVRACSALRAPGVGPRRVAAPRIESLGACIAADAAVDACRGCTSLELHGRTEGPVEARENRHDGAERTECMAPAAKHEQLKNEKARKEDDRERRLVEFEKTPECDHERKREPYGTNEAEDGKSEDGGRSQCASEHPKGARARIASRPIGIRPPINRRDFVALSS